MWTAEVRSHPISSYRAHHTKLTHSRCGPIPTGERRSRRRRRRRRRRCRPRPAALNPPHRRRSVSPPLPSYLMADILVNFSLLRPAHPRLLPAGLNPRRLGLSRRLRLLTASVPSIHRSSFKVHAAVAESNEKKWWEKNAGPNMIDIHSIQEFIDTLSQAGDKLVIAEFYGTWCGSCRALFPKLCRIAEEHPDILFVKVNFDENKPMCKRLNVRVLPFFHFYRGADGLLESFSCSLAKFQRLKDAIMTHNTARCSIGPPRGVGDLDLLESSTPQEKSPESSPSSSNLNR